MTQPLLSICIPTFNRAYWLDILLFNVLRQIERLPEPELVEVVVSNNCSTDNTLGILEKYAGYSSLHVFTNSKNEGLSNFGLVVARAEGKYSWLMGDDDEPTHGAIAKILSHMQTNPECDWFIPYALIVNPDGTQDVNWYEGSTVTWDLAIQDEFRLYCNCLTSMAGLGGLLSVLIGRTDLLVTGFADTMEWGNDSYFPHVAAFLHSANHLSGSLRPIPEQLVLHRTCNNGGHQDPWARILVDLDGWVLIANKLNLPPEFLAVMRRQHGFQLLLTLALYEESNAHQWKRARKALQDAGFQEETLQFADCVRTSIKVV